MTWDEFIQKIRRFKKETGKTGLNAPGLIRLLFIGAFDEMLSVETLQISACDRYPMLAKEMLAAMGSKAKLPKKRGKELVGIDKIDSVGRLMLWRHSSNPFISYEITDYCKSFLKQQGFERPAYRDDNILWVKNAKTPIDIRKSWHELFGTTYALQSYEQGKKMLAVMCIIAKVEKKMFQGTKESLVVTLFNGHEYLDSLRIWPGEDGKVSQVMIDQMEQYAMGLAIVKPKPWNDRPAGTIVKWIRM